MTVLSNELADDPLARGYSGMTDAQATDSLNDTLDRERNRTSMTGSEVLNAVNNTEYLALSASDKDRVWQLLHLGTLNPFGVEADLLLDIFGGGSTTITALVVARKEIISRGAELGLGVVKEGQVQRARA